jgi:hypothetical protein
MPNRYIFPLLLRKWLKINGTEGVRFELTRPFGLPVFKTGAINRSATPPEKLALDFAIVSAIGNQLRIIGQACPFYIDRRTVRPTTELLLDMGICSCELSLCRGAKKSDPSLRKRHRATQRFGDAVRPGAQRIDSKNCTSI